MTVSEYTRKHDKATKEWLDAVEFIHTCSDEENAEACETARVLYNKGPVLLRAWTAQKFAEKAQKRAEKALKDWTDLETKTPGSVNKN